MIKQIKQNIALVALTCLPVSAFADGLESWVYQPEFADGLAAVGCASSSGSFNIDKRRAESAARSSLIQSINMKASTMDRHVSELVSNNQGTSVSETFVTISKQISESRLRQSKIVKLDVGEIYGEKQVCAMAAIDNRVLESYFNDMVSMSGTNIDPDDKTAMYQEFKTQKAVSDLEGELKRLTQ
ncbi:LPP20 family lipoprotein [Vibrio sp. SCSIO 43140]|uniref:hypothetical protein n=1 Tax=Vibrio sp. SCSIO 43140 TaxID=2819100 RepID=UPI002075CEAC|nr:hypothetical protein [Vibrio sp. SCSIO 43140]USD61361.1 LPP20 family lipoprotein [Vibrio sp. SCSIO 43140]